MGTHPIFESDFDCLTEKKMIKLDRRRKRKPKNDEEEEQERTEVNFAQDAQSERLKAINDEEQKGGLIIRRKSSGGEEIKEAARKGPAMPPPAWSGECTEDSYKLEVLKGGKIIGGYKLAQKSTHVLGKLETCDLRLEHPSVSRYHCILQWHVQDQTW